MSWEFDEVLSHELVHKESWDESRGTLEFRIGVLQTIITIELGRFMDCDWTKFWRSHAIKAPHQHGPYLPSKEFGDDPPHALHQAISSFTRDYEIAVEKGHTPSDEWLVRLPLV